MDWIALVILIVSVLLLLSIWSGIFGKYIFPVFDWLVLGPIRLVLLIPLGAAVGVGLAIRDTFTMPWDGTVRGDWQNWTLRCCWCGQKLPANVNKRFEVCGRCTKVTLTGYSGGVNWMRRRVWHGAAFDGVSIVRVPGLKMFDTTWEQSPRSPADDRLGSQFFFVRDMEPHLAEYTGDRGYSDRRWHVAIESPSQAFRKEKEGLEQSTLALLD